MSDEEFSAPAFIEMVRAGDEAAFRRLVREYTAHLHRAALGMGFDADAAAELAQDTWITFYEKAPSFRGDARIRTYLFAILYRKAMEKRREYAKMQKHDPIDDVVAARFNQRGAWARPPMNPEEFALAAETEELLRGCLDGLPLSQRSAFMLKEVEGYESGEICNVLEVSVTNLGVLLFRARNRLRECLEAKHEKGNKVPK